MIPPNSDFRDLLSLLNRFGVRYLVVGGCAVMLYTEPRYTKDLDLVIGTRPEELEGVRQALEEFGFPMSDDAAAQLTLPNRMIKIGHPPGRIDILNEIDGVDFDAAGQLSVSQDALGYRTSYSYDPAGNRTVVQDANGKLTTTADFSNRNLPEATIDAMGYRSTYAFDQQSRLVSTRDANGSYVTNIYDTVGRLAVVQNQLGENARQYGYDLANRIVTMADAANRVRSYTFDAAGQNTATTFPDGKIATFAFDKVGRRTTMVDWGGTSTYSFDALGRQNGQTDAAGFVQAYGYDPNGNRTGLNLVGTGLFTFAFDSLNRLATAQKPGNALYTLSYDADSRRTTMMLGNGTTRKYQFDNRGQLTTQIEFSGATPVCTIVDGYDPVGNRLTRNLDGNPVTWTYDDLYRLTGQQKAGQVCTYTLDGVGNLKTMWEGGSFPKTFTFNAADHLVTMVEGASLTTYAWTGYGALESEITGSQTTGYAYNGQYQLAVVTEPSGDKTTYSFDGDGLRRSVATTNVSQDPPTLDVTTMVWDGSDYLLLNEPTQNRVVLTLDSEIVSCGSKDLLTDPLGSLVKEISAGASLGSLVPMSPYGTLLPTSGKVSIPFVYIAAYGYYNDSADRDYVRARELYKKLGRWMQTDPLWPNERAYGYVGSSPLTLVDPSGLKGCKVYICTVNSSKLNHKFICVEGPNGGCSMGMYPEGPGDTGYGNNCSQPGVTTCKLISTDCGYASEVCACTRRWKNGSPGTWDYIKVGTCWGFVGVMACCGCGGDQDCLLSKGCKRPPCGSIYDGLPEVGPHDQCPPGYKERVGNGWVVG